MPTIKLTYEEQLQRDIDQLDDRLDRLELINQYEHVAGVRIERQRLVDELNELTITESLSLPVVAPVTWDHTKM